MRRRSRREGACSGPFGEKGLRGNPGRRLESPPRRQSKEDTGRRAAQTPPPAPPPRSHLLINKAAPTCARPLTNIRPVLQAPVGGHPGLPPPQAAGLGAQLHPANWPAGPAPSTPVPAPGPDAGGTGWAQWPLTPVSSGLPGPCPRPCCWEALGVWGGGTCVPRKFPVSPTCTRGRPCPPTRRKQQADPVLSPHQGPSPRAGSPARPPSGDAERYSRAAALAVCRPAPRAS